MTPRSGGVQAYRRRAAAVEREIDAAVAAVKAERRDEHDQAKAAHAKREATRRRYTREDVAGAGFIHDGYRWRRVVRVNAKTVSVENALMAHWEPERIPFAKVYGVQQPLAGIADEITAGVREAPPCQEVSAAGRRRGEGAQ